MHTAHTKTPWCPASDPKTVSCRALSPVPGHRVLCSVRPYERAAGSAVQHLEPALLWWKPPYTTTGITKD